MRSRLCAVLVPVSLLACSVAVAAGISLPPGSRLDMNGGAAALAAQDLHVDGALTLGSGSVLGLASLRLGAGGQADLGSGTVELGGDWENRGSLAAGSSRVRFLDGPAESALLGSTTFASASFVSASGKRYRFESGSTQSVAAQLDILGTGAPVQIDVTQPGSVAFLDLLPSGTQSIANVGVSDVHAIGQALAPDQTNQGGRGNDTGWFGNGGGPIGQVMSVPSSSPAGLALFALTLLGAALLAFRRFAGASS
jgi:hypothetical protein